jgi:AraC family transcriptional regulator
MSETAADLSRAGDPLDRAMRHIEAHRRELLTLDALAGVAGLSAYHFAREFAARFGVSPMAYARARRMAAAAEQLSGEVPPALIDLAFDCGFESQEGFTRAFKRAYGVSPGRFRRADLKPDLENPPMPEVMAAAHLTMVSAPVRKPGFRVAGVSGVFDESTRHQIPALWPRLIERVPLPGQTGFETFGVCWGDVGGKFHYMAAAPISADAPAPEGLEAKDVPAQTYLVFRQQLSGPELHPQMQAAAREIWGERLPKSGHKLARGPDLEFYPPDFEPGMRDGWVEWWVPVEE